MNRFISHRRRFPWLAAGLLFWGCSADLAHESPYDPAAPASKQAPAQLSGRLVLEGEREFSDVNVILAGPTEKATVTQADGSFSTNGLIPGHYRLTYSAGGFEEAVVDVELSLAEHRALAPTVLPLRTARVSGDVVADATGLVAVGGSRVSIRRSFGPRSGKHAPPGLASTADAAVDAGDAFADSTLVDAAGSYAFDAVKAGTYVVTVAQVGAVSGAAEFTVSGDAEDVTVDTLVLKPISGSFVVRGALGDGAASSAFTVTRDVSLVTTGANARYAQVGEAHDGECSYGAERDLDAVIPFTLSGGDGVKVVCMRLKDTPDSNGREIRSSIVLDTTLPSIYLLQANGGRTYTNDGLVPIDLFAADGGSGLYRIHYRFGAAATTAADYVPSFTAVLTTEGSQDLWLQVEDRAGNLSLPSAVAIVYDGTPPAPVGLTVTPADAIGGSTAKQVVTLAVTYPADAVEMRVSNLADLSGTLWQPVKPSLPWQLPTGDGDKTIYLQARDAAGNASTTATATITLDQTAPDTPALQVFDTNGDGFALSATSVELRWSEGVASDLAAYELEVFVEGLGTNFVPEATLAPGVSTYWSGVTATTGYTHNYRIRAKDVLGNASAWSNIAVAKPFAPAATVCSVESDLDTFTLGWRPGAGTFALEATLSKRDQSGVPALADLPANQLAADYWAPYLLPQQPAGYELLLRQSNQDNSLSYRSTFDVPGPRSIAVANGGLYARLRIDRAGAAHLGHWDLFNNDLLYTTNAGGAWVTTKVDEIGQVGEYADMALDNDGAVHFSYSEGAPSYNLKYATNASGAWQTFTVDTTGTTGQYTAIALDRAGAAHISYYDQTNNDLRYATNRSGAWQLATIDAVGNTGRYTSIVVDDGEHVHIAYIDTSQQKLRYATNKSGGWVIQQVGPAVNYTAMTMDRQGALHIAYQQSSHLWYAENVTGTWVTREVDSAASVARDPGIAVDDQGAVYISYQESSSGSLKLATNQSGAWQIGVVDASGSVSDRTSLSLDGNGRVSLAYRDASDNTLHFMALSPGFHRRARIDAAGDVGSKSSYARAATGVEFVAYFDDANADLRFASNVTGTWETTLVDGTGTVGWFPSLAVDQAGRPHVAYYKVNGPLKYASADTAGAWTLEVVDASADVGRGASLALDSNGAAHISYHDFTAKDLKYATNASGAWVTTTLESAGNVGYFTSIAVDSQDKIHIAYQHPGLKQLKYATNRSGAWVFTTVDGDGDAGWAPALVLDANDQPHISYAVFPGVTRYATLKGGTWVVESLDSIVSNTGIYSAIAIAENRVGIVVVSNVSGDLVFLENGAGRWVPHVLDADDSDAPSLRFGAFDRAYLSYYDPTAKDLKYAAFQYTCSGAKTVERVQPFQ